ncbi:UNVERIFIED_CONTAM: Serine/threonine-protein kinase BRSK2 [Trichonephila clavipes]
MAALTARPSQWRYTPKKLCPVVRRKRPTALVLSRCLGVEATEARVFHGFPKLFVFFSHGNIFVNICGYNVLCSFDGQGNFQATRFGSLLRFWVSSLIAGANMTWDPLYSFDMLSDGSPLTPRRYPYGRSRRSSMSSSLHVTSPAVSPLSSPKPTPRGTPEESPLNTPPGSPAPSASDEVSLTPDSSPELTKRSWFGSLMTNERDETHVILVKDRPLSSVKADLIHAFLSVSYAELIL